MVSRELVRIINADRECSRKTNCLVSHVARRDFLALAGRSGLALGLVPLLDQKSVEQRNSASSRIVIPGASNLLASDLMQDIVAAGLGPLIVAGLTLHEFSQAFSKFDFDNLPSGLKKYYRQAGGANRDNAAARALWRKVPGAVRINGVAALDEFHRPRVWSHIISRANGGSDLARNGIWWDAKKNLQLGPRNMTLLSLLDAKAALTMAGLKATVPLVVKPLLTGSMASVVTVLVFVIAELALRFYLGEISGWELATSVMISALMAGAASFIVSGLIMGIALAFPVLLPFFQIVMVPLAVAGLVFMPIQINALVNGWWRALDQKGHLDHFIAGLHLFEEIVRDLSASRLTVRNENELGLRLRISELWSNLASRVDLGQLVPRVDIIEFISELGQDVSDLVPEFAWLESVGGAIAGTGHRAVEALPDWQLAVPSWKFDIGLGKFTPDFGFLERLPALDMDLKTLLVDAEMPSLRKLTVPLPDFGVANRSAQDALASASTYLTTRGSAALEQRSV